MLKKIAFLTRPFSLTMGIVVRTLLGLDSDTFYIYHVAAVMVDNLRRLLLGINLSDKANYFSAWKESVPLTYRGESNNKF